jgi:hypothetical protein
VIDEPALPNDEQLPLFGEPTEAEAPVGQGALFDEVAEPAPDAPVDDVAYDGSLFGSDQDFHAVWREWQGMPEFSMEDMMPWYQVIVNFAEPSDLEDFAKLVGQPVHATARRTASIWFPKQLKFGPSAIDKRYRDPKDEAFWKRQPRNFRKDPNE